MVVLRVCHLLFTTVHIAWGCLVYGCDALLGGMQHILQLLCDFLSPLGAPLQSIRSAPPDEQISIRCMKVMIICMLPEAGLSGYLTDACL